MSAKYQYYITSLSVFRHKIAYQYVSAISRINIDAKRKDVTC